MKERTFVISTFEQLIKVGTTFGMNWFRGQSKVFGNLTPSVFRTQYWDDLIRFLNQILRANFISNLCVKHPTFSEKLPQDEDYLEWLFFMQHHGLPTRLLDWSENILFAAYFAVINDPKEDAEIWSLLPWKLNENHGFWGTPLQNSRVLKYFASEPFHSNPSELVKELGLDNEPIIPLAILPKLKFQRIRAQQSCFTIHRPPEIGSRIEDVIKEDNMFTRYIIPAEKKKDFICKLDYLGVNRSTLYPDLDGLAGSIKELSFSIGWGQPELLKLEKYLSTAKLIK